MHAAARVDRAPGGDQRLPRDLAAEHPGRPVRRADAAEQVQLEPLEVEQRDEVVEGGLPAATPSSASATAAGRQPDRRSGSRIRQAWSSSPSRCTRIRLVDPDAPGGEPATITTVSPGLNRPIDRIALSTWRTIASVEVT